MEEARKRAMSVTDQVKIDSQVGNVLLVTGTEARNVTRVMDLVKANLA